VTVAGPRPKAPPARSLADVAEWLGLPTPPLAGSSSAPPEPVVTGVCLDSRTVRPGDLYAALPGEHTHGARFAAGAVDRGAVAILTDPAGSALIDAAVDGDSGVAAASASRLVVADPRAVLGEVSAYLYGNAVTDGGAGLTLVGVTGTNGKTTTAYLLDGALAALGVRTGLIGTVETRVANERIRSARTTPEAPDLHALIATMRERAVATCVMEVSSHALTLHRVDGLLFDLALFTNLSQDHLDMHGTMEDYFAAKSSLFTPQRARAGIVYLADDWGRRLSELAGIPVVTVGEMPEADYRIAMNVNGTFRLSGAGADLRAATSGRQRITVDLTLKSALPGRFNAANTALAAIALIQLGYAADDVSRAILTDPHVPGRMEDVSVAGSADRPRGIVDYAHTPDAVEVALKALRPEAPGGLVVVLGAGGDRDRGKRAAMGAAAAHGARVVVVTDDNPRSEDPAAIRAAVLQGARAAGTAARLIETADRRDAIRRAVAEAMELGGRGVVVAVVGKGHETGQEIAGVVHPFDDRVELRAALAAAAPGGSR
jgi:UDP-N-acetylmuramoyl-L-alanyl-D-glutamate--2,6-diaminopimelate ligase